MKKEARIDEMFKFTKMTKKASFLPALKARDDGLEKMNSFSIGDPYVAWRDKNKLCFPDRAFEKKKIWKIQKGISDVLFHSAR